jgi:capsular exopolysaccharide synthesis family protein
MELQLYLDILKRRALVIVVVTAITMSVVTAAGLVIPPIYQATATVRVLLDAGVADLRLWEDYSRRLLNTYGCILTSDPFLEETINRLLPQTSSLTIVDLRENVEVEVVPNTELISVAVQDESPTLAQDLANTLATLLIEYAQDLYVGSSKSTLQIVEEQLASMEDDLDYDRQQLVALLAESEGGAEIEALQSQIEFKEDAYDRLLDRYEMARLNESLQANSITIISPARLPLKPSNSLGLTQIGLSLVIGLFGGVGLALVLENLDTRIHSPQQLEHLSNLPVLGTAPRGLLSPHGSGAGNGIDSSKPIDEAYRLLSINLQALREEIPLQTILITSAVPKEGKSTVAANLAQTLADRGQTVFLVEGDLRRPTLTGVLGIGANDETGLGWLLTERPALNHEALSQVIQPAKQPSLFVIGSGPGIANPTALLASPSMGQLLDYLGAQGHATLLDAPPVLGMADVSVLAPKVEGVVLVVGQAQSKREQVLAALKQLQASRARVLGFVFLQKSDREWSYE